MPYYVRPMLKEDIPQVSEIDREAFPTMFPPPNFERELRNKLTHFYVVCDEDKLIEQPEVVYYPEKNPGPMTRLKRWFYPGSLSGSELPSPAACGQYINGYVGFWVMADEAHITTIAVREELRRQGIGELLLLEVLNRTKELKADIVTLEVRLSNNDAQSLYSKYGFKQVGVRKGYYTDNREDGIVMTAADITSAAYQTEIKQLSQAHSAKWGAARYHYPDR